MKLALLKEIQIVYLPSFNTNRTLFAPLFSSMSYTNCQFLSLLYDLFMINRCVMRALWIPVPWVFSAPQRPLPFRPGLRGSMALLKPATLRAARQISRSLPRCTLVPASRPAAAVPIPPTV